MNSRKLRRQNGYNGTLAVLCIVTAVVLLVQPGYGEYSSTLSDEETVGIVSEYVSITETGYESKTVFSTNEVGKGLQGVKYTGDDVPDTGWFAYKVESAANAADTVILVTIADRAAAAALGNISFWVTSTYSKTVHNAEVRLTPSSTADSVPTVEVDNGACAVGSIGVATGSGAYQFKIRVADMTSQNSATVSAGYTTYSLNGATALNTISGTAYSGKMIVSAVLEADRSVSDDGILKLRVSCTGFKDLGTSGWKYIMAVEPYAGGDIQYAWSTDGASWTYASGGAFSLDEETAYTATLYMAGIASGTEAYAWKEIPNDSKAVIDDGVIVFTHDSTWGS